ACCVEPSYDPHLAFPDHASLFPRHIHSFPTRRSSDLTDDIAGGVIFGVANNRHPASVLPNHISFRNAVRRVIRAFCMNVRTNFRSEEHTSELQSHLNLVCRLLLEKKTRSITL